MNEVISYGWNYLGKDEGKYEMLHTVLSTIHQLNSYSSNFDQKNI
jgi:hypothetical protein